MTDNTVTLVGNVTRQPELRAGVEARFWSKADRDAGPEACWTWQAGKTKAGYGGFHPSKGVTVLAHRMAYELAVGRIPDGLVIDHLCRNRACVNPSHMEPVTREENLRRGAGYGLANGMRTECKNGHEYTPATTYVDPQGGKRCRACALERDRARRELARQAATARSIR